MAAELRALGWSVSPPTAPIVAGRFFRVVMRNGTPLRWHLASRVRDWGRGPYGRCDCGTTMRSNGHRNPGWVYETVDSLPTGDVCRALRARVAP